MILKNNLFITAIVFVIVSCFAVSFVASACTGESFQKLVGHSEWDIKLRNYSLRLENMENTFKLSMADEKYFTFSAYKEEDRSKNHFSPFKKAYQHEFSTLFDSVLAFRGQENKGEFATSITWDHYPKSIKKWAKKWQGSALRENWNITEQYKRYNTLTGMISDFLKEDMHEAAQAMGFELTGASMEKMAYYKAGNLSIYDKVLKKEGINKNTKIPIPLMLYLHLKPLPQSTDAENIQTDLRKNCKVDSISVTAESNRTNVYCSFNNALDEYQLSGDTIRQDGTYQKILPMGSKKYHIIAGKLFQVILKASGQEKKASLYLRMNLKKYPEVYKEMITYLNGSFKRETRVKIPGIPQLKFYEYIPGSAPAFPEEFYLFLRQNGFVFKSFTTSIHSEKKAKKYPGYEKNFKPSGIRPEEKPFVPDIVLMKINRKE